MARRRWRRILAVLLIPFALLLWEGCFFLGLTLDRDYRRAGISSKEVIPLPSPVASIKDGYLFAKKQADQKNFHSNGGLVFRGASVAFRGKEEIADRKGEIVYDFLHKSDMDDRGLEMRIWVALDMAKQAIVNVVGEHYPEMDSHPQDISAWPLDVGDVLDIVEREAGPGVYSRYQHPMVIMIPGQKQCELIICNMPGPSGLGATYILLDNEMKKVEINKEYSM